MRLGIREVIEGFSAPTMSDEQGANSPLVRCFFFAEDFGHRAMGIAVRNDGRDRQGLGQLYTCPKLDQSL